MNARVREATEEDLPAILSLFDAAVNWLSDRKLEGQWGTEPFSEKPQVVGHFEGWIGSGDMYVAYDNNVILGAIVLSSVPPEYVAEVNNQNSQCALYLEAFVTDRRYAGHEIGRRVLDWSERTALELNLSWLQLDCWAENKALREYYRSVGFVELDEFDVGDWRGVLFEKPVPGI